MSGNIATRGETCRVLGDCEKSGSSLVIGTATVTKCPLYFIDSIDLPWGSIRSGFIFFSWIFFLFFIYPSPYLPYQPHKTPPSF